jgi:hypothetical protein
MRNIKGVFLTNREESEANAVVGVSVNPIMILTRTRSALCPT